MEFNPKASVFIEKTIPLSINCNSNKIIPKRISFIFVVQPTRTVEIIYTAKKAMLKFLKLKTSKKLITP